jgi:hypothetical protein
MGFPVLARRDELLLGGTALLGAAVAIGLFLSTQYIIAEKRPGLYQKTGLIHGLFAASGLALVVLGLGGPSRGVRFGSAGFGPAAAWIAGATLLGGLTILANYWRSRAPPMGLLAAHSLAGILAYTLLAVYLTMALITPSTAHLAPPMGGR